MYIWCSYCLSLIDEQPPFENSAVSHGICTSCLASLMKADPPEIRLAALAAFRDKLNRAGIDADVSRIPGLLYDARELGVRVSDVLVGVAGALLYEYGEAWHQGKISIAQEHRFTAFFETLLHFIKVSHPEIAIRLRDRSPKCLLTPVPGNRHTLGIRMLEVWLAEHGVTCMTVEPDLPADEIAALADQLRPTIVGLSISIPNQVAALTDLADSLHKLPAPPAVVAGGFAVKSSTEIARVSSAGVTLLPGLRDLAAFIESATPGVFQ